MEKLMLSVGLTISLCVCACFPSVAQPIHPYSHASLAEKIYLQLDGKVYTTNQTIWFKAIVTNAINHAPSKLSGVLYVELIGPDERVVEKKLVKLRQGIGDGFFDLNQSYAEGAWQIRAYTEWNKNFGADFIFTEYIQLFASSEKVKADPIGKITMVQGQNSDRRLNVSLNPFTIDSLHKKELTLVITFDDKKDTLYVRKNGANLYPVDYAIPEQCQFVTLQMLTRNQFSFSKTIALNENHFDLQFFPESGELVHGLRSRVGFKAVDYNGKGKRVEGEILNEKGEVITHFMSNQLGMGSFVLARVDSAAKYFARLSFHSEEKPSVTFPLPAVARRGNVMTVYKNGNELRVRAASNYLKNDSIILRISCRGVVYLDVKERLKDGAVVFALPADSLPEGVIACTLMSDRMQPLAERLSMNEKPGSRIQLGLSADKLTCSQRDLTRLNIEASYSNGKPANASLSLLVLNREQMGNIQGMRQNILSHLLLTSDLRGEIENPGFYFGRDKERSHDLDALLLTQGWRKYLYTKPSETFVVQPESALPVSGTVSGVLSRKKKKVSEITIMTFGKTRSILTQKTDSMGRFKFNIGDEYGQNLNVLIQSANNSGKKVNYTIELDKKVSPAISFNHVKSIERVDSVVHTIVEKNIERKKVDDSFKLSAGDILLGEVVVEAYKMTPERKKVTDEYGKPDEVISGKAIQEKEAKWSYGLYSVLLANFPDKVIIRRASNGNLYAKVNYSEITLVVIDGIPVRPEEYPFIPNIPPSEVSSFEIIENAKNFSKLYLELFPTVRDVPAWGDVIAIYTHAGKGIYGARQPVGIVRAAVPVFAAPREFYAPKYENIQSTDWYKPDLRALVHWEPKIRSDSTGKATSAFYNADNLGEMLVVVEAISNTGEIGYQELIYNVKKNKDNKEIR